MELDYQLANGKWCPCKDRSEEFLNYCIEYNYSEYRYKKMDKEQIINSLNEGKEVKFNDEWYCEIRSSDFAKNKEAERKKAESMREAEPLKLTGQLWECCDCCGQKPIYMSVGVCEECAIKGIRR